MGDVRLENEMKVIDLKARAQAFFAVGEILNYSYEGDYSQSSIEAFFDSLAQDLLLKADELKNKVN